MSLNLHSGYWQYCIAEEYLPKTAFLTWYKLYEWIVMQTRLMNAPIILIQMMKNLFMDMVDKGVVVFLDDILIYSTMAQEHCTLLGKVFACLGMHVFYYNLRKCSFL